MESGDRWARTLPYTPEDSASDCLFEQGRCLPSGSNLTKAESGISDCEFGITNLRSEEEQKHLELRIANLEMKKEGTKDTIGNVAWALYLLVVDTQSYFLTGVVFRSIDIHINNDTALSVVSFDDVRNSTPYSGRSF